MTHASTITAPPGTPRGHIFYTDMMDVVMGPVPRHDGKVS
jgi:hypothetical protein